MPSVLKRYLSRDVAQRTTASALKGAMSEV
jgi:hypothetical protein